jgi:hypothetical protein
MLVPAYKKSHQKTCLQDVMMAHSQLSALSRNTVGIHVTSLPCAGDKGSHTGWVGTPPGDDDAHKN